MSQLRFGELLGKVVNLTRHDVDEILEEQNSSHRRFGEIALSLGLCDPEHVWQAWCDQLLTQIQQVDLDALGVDAQAAGLIDPEVAMRLGAIPIRQLGRVVIVAVADPNIDRVASELLLIGCTELRFVLADLHQIQRAISTYYAAGPAAA